MEVRCNRCGTEYEFDDVLISERGTTVKCTNCGFQFKVFAAGLTGNVPERWVVRTLGGEEIAFASLRELQRGIAERRVGPQDLLSRGNEQPRRLGLIAELEPFFAAQVSPPVGPIGRTLHGVAPERPSDPSFRPGEPFFRANEPQFRKSDPYSATPSAAPATLVEHRSFDSIEGNAAPTLRTTPVPEQVPRSSVVPARADTAEPSRPRGSAPVHLTSERAGTAVPQRGGFERLSSTLPSAPSPPPTPWPPASAAGSGTPPIDFGLEEEVDTGSARSRWIAALVVAGVAVLLALTVGRRYLTRAANPEAPAPATATDPRVAALLSEGNRLLGDGDWEGARERLLKASALAERDTRVLSALARLEGLHADAAWLGLRLVDPNATVRVQASQRELERRVARAEQAADAALAEAPKDLVALRARIDAHRMKGELAKARQHLAPVAAAPGDPANAYVLAAIDLSEDGDIPASALDRLRVAAAAESPAGRAQAALVYALARAGRGDDAESELSKLGSDSPLLALVPELKAFLSRAPGAAASARPSSGKAAPSEKAAPSAPAAKAAPPPQADKAGGPHSLLARAKSAASSGNLALAEELYYRILESLPGNSEALRGLGDVKRRKNDTQAAEELYERAASESADGKAPQRRAEPDSDAPDADAPNTDAAPKSEPAPAPKPEPGAASDEPSPPGDSTAPPGSP